jgi:hypothetical protein
MKVSAVLVFINAKKQKILPDLQIFGKIIKLSKNLVKRERYNREDGIATAQIHYIEKKQARGLVGHCNIFDSEDFQKYHFLTLLIESRD